LIDLNIQKIRQLAQPLGQNILACLQSLAFLVPAQVWDRVWPITRHPLSRSPARAEDKAGSGPAVGFNAILGELTGRAVGSSLLRSTTVGPPSAGSKEESGRSSSSRDVWADGGADGQSAKGQRSDARASKEEAAAALGPLGTSTTAAPGDAKAEAKSPDDEGSRGGPGVGRKHAGEAMSSGCSEAGEARRIAIEVE
jgi:hypothetical protein